jgi:hypothetical protein
MSGVGPKGTDELPARSVVRVDGRGARQACWEIVSPAWGEPIRDRNQAGAQVPRQPLGRGQWSPDRLGWVSMGDPS